MYTDWAPILAVSGMLVSSSGLCKQWLSRKYHIDCHRTNTVLHFEHLLNWITKQTHQPLKLIVKKSQLNNFSSEFLTKNYNFLCLASWDRLISDPSPSEWELFHGSSCLRWDKAVHHLSTKEKIFHA